MSACCANIYPNCIGNTFQIQTTFAVLGGFRVVGKQHRPPRSFPPIKIIFSFYPPESDSSFLGRRKVNLYTWSYNYGRAPSGTTSSVLIGLCFDCSQDSFLFRCGWWIPAGSFIFAGYVYFTATGNLFIYFFSPTRLRWNQYKTAGMQQNNVIHLVTSAINT